MGAVADLDEAGRQEANSVEGPRHPPIDGRDVGSRPEGGAIDVAAAA